MSKLRIISILAIALFIVLEFQPQAQTPPPAADQKTDKPAFNADKLIIDWIDRMNALSSWYLTFDGKEDGAEKVVDHMMEMFAPDVIAEVPPHDERQQGTVQLVGSAQVRQWVEKIAKTQVDIKFLVKRQTMKEFEGEYMIFSRPLPWGGMAVAAQLIEADSKRMDRKRFMQVGGVFIQLNKDAKIYRMRLVLSEKEEIVDLGG